MAFLKALLFLLSTSSTVLALPPAIRGPEIAAALSRRTAPHRSNGTSDGFFYSFWDDGNGQVVDYKNGAGGSYSVRWTNCSDFYGGKGWMPGAVDRRITYSGKFDVEGNAYLSVYGYAEKPLTEYYIVESYGSFDPTLEFASQGATVVTLQVDGGTYRLGKKRIWEETANGSDDVVLTQLWSVRKAGDRRTTGTVDVKAHFDAWAKKLGVNVGVPDFLIVSTEGWHSSGSAEIEVKQSA